MVIPYPMSSSLSVRYNKSYKSAGLIDDNLVIKFTQMAFSTMLMVLLMLIRDYDREIQVVLWCARTPPVVLGKFMV